MNLRAIQKEFKRLGTTLSVCSPDEALLRESEERDWEFLASFFTRSRLPLPRNRISASVRDTMKNHPVEFRCSAAGFEIIRGAKYKMDLCLEISDVHTSSLELTISTADFMRRYRCEITDAGPQITPVYREGKSAQGSLRLRGVCGSRKKRSAAEAMAWPHAEARRIAPLTRGQYENYIALVHRLSGTNLLDDNERVIPAYGKALTNGWHPALIRVARASKSWIRPLEDWRPCRHGRREMFRSLVTHLFALRPIPPCLDTAWFSPNAACFNWYVTIGKGNSVQSDRSFTFPYTVGMEKRMMTAPEDLTIEEAIRWGEVHELGGDRAFFEAIQRTCIPSVLRRRTARHQHWRDVIAWLLAHPEIDTENYGRFCHYLQSTWGKAVADYNPESLLRIANALGVHSGVKSKIRRKEVAAARKTKKKTGRAPNPRELKHVDAVLRELREHFKEWPAYEGREHDLIAFAFYEGCGGTECCGDLLGRAAPLALGNELVQNHDFRWVMIPTGNHWDYAVEHRFLQTPINLMTLEDLTWHPLDPNHPPMDDTWHPGEVTNESLEHIVEHIEPAQKRLRSDLRKGRK